MTCQEVQDKLAAYLANALADKETLAMEAHLSECRTCQEDLQEMYRLDTLLQKEVPAYWQDIRPAPGFLVHLEQLDPPRVGVWGAFMNNVLSWLRRPRYTAGIALIAAIVVIVILIGELDYGQGILGQRSESPSVAEPAGRVEAPLVPSPLSLTPLEEVRQQVEFPVQLPSQLPKELNSQQPVFHIFELDDGRNLVRISYFTANGDALTLYETRSGPAALFLDQAWERIQQPGEPGSGDWQQGKPIELQPSIQAVWVETYGPQNRKISNFHWREGDLELLLSGSFTLEELVRVARSIQ